MRKKFHEIPNTPEGIAERRRTVEGLTGKKLEAIGSFTINLPALAGRNIDNPIGAVQVPVGVAGPLKINGMHAKGEYPIFLATTEGALVASVNRGCTALNESGGANVYLIKDAMTRAPVFKAKNTADALKFVKWVRENCDGIRKVAESTTRHGKLLEMQPFAIGRTVFLRFVYETGDASGLNMVTIATDKAVEFIDAGQKLAHCVALSGNMCVDKKPSALNLLLGRGKTLVAEAVIKRKVVADVLKTTPERFVDVAYRKNLLGSALSGSLSFTAHQANVIAAMFIALGQDAAHVVDGSLGITTAEMEGNSLYVSAYIPALYIGTVGGGTRSETQAELLAATGAKGARELAEVIAGAVLAGEISLLAALSSGHLAKAHAKLGR